MGDASYPRRPVGLIVTPFGLYADGDAPGVFYERRWGRAWTATFPDGSTATVGKLVETVEYARAEVAAGRRQRRRPATRTSSLFAPRPRLRPAGPR